MLPRSVTAKLRSLRRLTASAGSAPITRWTVGFTLPPAAVACAATG